METEAWTVRLGRELQQLGPDTTDRTYFRLSHELSLAINQVKFVRGCYNKPAVKTTQQEDN